jgi:hypothetical protein
MVKRTYLAPVLSTERSPPSCFAVTSHAINEQTSANGGLKVAAVQDWPDHIKVKEAGSTAPEMITPSSPKASMAATRIESGDTYPS